VPAEALRVVRQRIDAGDFGLDADTQRAVGSRIADMADALTAADRALAKVPQPAVAEAAGKLAYLFYIGGHGWTRYLAENASSGEAATAIGDATRTGVGAIVPHLERALATRAASKITRRDEVTWTLPCVACDGDAVTLTRTRVSPESPEQLVVSSLSPVTVFRPITGPRMLDLVTLLEAGSVPAVATHLRETQPGGCDAWCQTCGYIFCKSHYAIEAQWSGSWHEATYATCPLGHEHEID
jgi:hypothetical protein